MNPQAAGWNEHKENVEMEEYLLIWGALLEMN